MKKDISIKETAIEFLALVLAGVLIIWILFGGIKMYTLLVNWLFTLGIMGIALLISRSSRISLAVYAAVNLFVFYVNEYVFFSRHTYVQYNDLYCISDALRIANRYPLTVNSNIVLKFILVIAIVTGYCILKSKLHRSEKSSKKQCSLICGIVFLISSLVWYEIIILDGLPIKVPDFNINDFTVRNGLYYSLYSEYKLSKPEVPNGYSSEKAASILDRYKSDDETDSTEALDIIVIMNESLADYSLIGKPDYDNDPLSRLHALNGNCKKGSLAVSIYGSNTCNTEFEFLTGNSLCFFPQNSVPYMQFIKNDINSVLWDMKDLNYNCFAIHPYIGEEWRRTTVYNFLGFDDFISGEDFGSMDLENIENITANGDLIGVDFGANNEYIRGFISDRQCYKKVLETLTDGPDMIFAVTVQNHGGYNGIYTSDAYKSLPNAINEFLSSEVHSDIAFEELIRELEKRNEKTVVLLFGDHQPILEAPVSDIFIDYEAGGYKYSDFIVPYVAWANFDMDFDIPDTISTNYLSAVLKQNAGIKLTEWDRFRLDVMQEYPVLTANFIADSDGNIYSPSECGSSELINDYKILQYHQMNSSAH